jgi:hypothetical protein
LSRIFRIVSDEVLATEFLGNIGKSTVQIVKSLQYPAAAVAGKFFQISSAGFVFLASCRTEQNVSSPYYDTCSTTVASNLLLLLRLLRLRLI